MDSERARVRQGLIESNARLALLQVEALNHLEQREADGFELTDGELRWRSKMSDLLGKLIQQEWLFEQTGRIA
jgi:hypothetical protein